MSISRAPREISSWTLRRFRYIAEVRKGRLPSSAGSDAVEVAFAPYLTMEYLRGEVAEPELMPLEPDLLQAEERDTLLLWDGSNAGEFLRSKQGIVSSTAARVTPRGIDPEFFYWACKGQEDLLRSETIGAGIPHVSWEFLANIRVPVPNELQQRAIASYLNRETMRLDALVAAKERVLGLLAEKRQTLITRAVTRGLDTRAPLRDSGIPWLGEIPAHWETKRAKWLFRERDERSKTGEEILLSLRMERGLVPHNDVSVKHTLPEELVDYKKVATGEVVVNRMRAASGLVAVALQDGLVSPDYAVFQMTPSGKAEYFVNLFKTELMQAVFRSESTGLGTGSSGFLRLYSESFLSLWLPCPSTHEQAAILRHIDDAITQLGAVRVSTERTITLLKERRAALIAAAVKGQINVESPA